MSHREITHRTPEEFQAVIAAAIAAGTHCPIEQWRTVCEQCRQWVPSIYYTTFDGKRICPDCADVIGQGPKAAEARRLAQAARRPSEFTHA